MGIRNSTSSPAQKSRWLDWRPKAQTIGESAENNPTTTSNPGFVGFVGSSTGVSSIIESKKSLRKAFPRENQIIQKTCYLEPTKPTKPRLERVQVFSLPAIPAGLVLVNYKPKEPPVLIESYAVVTDIRKFIEVELQELYARLHSPVQIRGGWGVFTILDRLRQVGVELEIVTPNGQE